MDKYERKRGYLRWRSTFAHVLLYLTSFACEDLRPWHGAAILLCFSLLQRLYQDISLAALAASRTDTSRILENEMLLMKKDHGNCSHQVFRYAMSRAFSSHSTKRWRQVPVLRASRNNSLRNHFGSCSHRRRKCRDCSSPSEDIEFLTVPLLSCHVLIVSLFVVSLCFRRWCELWGLRRDSFPRRWTLASDCL
jgi:hypothetical protein